MCTHPTLRVVYVTLRDDGLRVSRRGGYSAVAAYDAAAHIVLASIARHESVRPWKPGISSAATAMMSGLHSSKNGT